MAIGYLNIQTRTAHDALPISGVQIRITDFQGNSIYQLTTDQNGETQTVPLETLDKSFSQNQYYSGLPYKSYNVLAQAAGFNSLFISDIPIFDGETASLPLLLIPMQEIQRNPILTEIPIGKPAVAAQGPRQQEGSVVSPYVLRQVVIPNPITVHLGTPSSSAANVQVSFPDYVKNVASSEIYPTWPENALRANIYAQISFALNRVFTEWYPSRGYSFQITNHTGYDQYYVPGRNIFTNISRIVDEIFTTYIRRPGALNPLFAEYCNGSTVTCAGLSQWGTVSLAQNGYTPLRILQRYYGNVELVQATQVRNIESSYPGTALRVGSRGAAVRTIQRQLNRIRRNYPAIPAISPVDGIFGSETRAAVTSFQRVFNLTADGIVGRGTWNRISNIYVAVTRMAEINGESEPLPDNRPSGVLRQGDRGPYVRLAQYFLRVVAGYYNSVRPIALDGIFGNDTRNAVIDFQRRFGLTADGIIGPATWNSLYNVFMGIANTSGLVVPYPGTLLREGSRGDNVRLMQEYLQTIRQRYTSIPPLAADGIFGPDTRRSVVAFQNTFGLEADGIIGRNTWDRIIMARLLL